METRGAGDRRRGPDLGDAVTALLSEQAGYTRYQLSQLEARRGSGRARPFGFDESGIPIPSRGPGLAQRVARLLGTR